MPCPAVSVTLPCFNAEATLPACLDSLLAQSLKNIEIVAVDDGSEDTTASILRAYAQRDARVRPIFERHGGVAVAANTALAATRGRYVARMDADDLAFPERLAAQASWLDTRSKIGLVGCRVRFGGDRNAAGGYAHYVDWTNRLLTREAIGLNRFVESPFAFPSVMFRRELYLEHGGFRDGNFPEDYEFLLRLLDAGVVMEKVDAELLVWNDLPTRLTRTDPRYAVEAFYRVKAEYLARWLRRRNPHYPEVGIIGAGRPTRKRAEMLESHGVRIVEYYDLDPRKVGQVLNERPVLHREDVPRPGRRFLISYVASRGARHDIAAFLGTRGYRLGRDWIAAA
ncbi:MAG: glycosyltransferase family 2 protein [Desulfovibrionaceae bacterium]